MSDVASKELCQELYELSGWEFDQDHRHIEKVWIQSFSTSEMGQGHEDYDKTPPEKRRQYHVGDWVVRENPKNFIGVPESVPWGWANKYYQETVTASIPAYDLGYLLRKLPLKISYKGKIELTGEDEDYYGFQMAEAFPKGWQIDWRDANDGQFLAVVDAKLENCATKAAIELFKQKVLTRG